MPPRRPPERRTSESRGARPGAPGAPADRPQAGAAGRPCPGCRRTHSTMPRRAATSRRGARVPHAASKRRRQVPPAAFGVDDAALVVAQEYAREKPCVRRVDDAREQVARSRRASSVRAVTPILRRSLKPHTSLRMSPGSGSRVRHFPQRRRSRPDRIDGRIDRPAMANIGQVFDACNARPSVRAGTSQRDDRSRHGTRITRRLLSR